MGNTSEKETGQNTLSTNISPSAIALEELRHLLLAPEQAQLGSMKERLDALKVGPAEVGEVLSEAIRLQSQKNNSLKESLTPFIREQFNEEFSEAYKRSVIEAPTVITEAVSPILVPALTEEFKKEFPQTFLRAVKDNPKAVADAVSPIIMMALGKWVKKLIDEKVQVVHQSKIGELVQTVNQALEKESPLQRLKWRWQSFRTGLPYEDIRQAYLLARFKVMHVFLIHAKTGILLNRISASDEADLREDIVASMMGAVKKVLEDIGEKTDPNVEDRLTVLEFQKKRFFIEMGPDALLAVVIKQDPPPEWRETIRETLKKIHKEFGSQLEGFNGTMDGFEHTTPFLEEIVASSQGHRSELFPNKKISKKWIAVAGIILLGCWAGISIYNAYKWDKFVGFVEDLDKKEAGLFITSLEKNEEQRVLIKGFRDPSFQRTGFEDLFNNIGTKAGISPDSLDLNFTPFFPLSSEYILRLANALLSPPDTVDLFVSDHGELQASGIASSVWISEFRDRAKYLPGISDVKEEKLRKQEDLELLQLINVIEDFQLLFSPGKDTISSDSNSQITVLSQNILRLDELAQELGKRIILEIHGHASEDGPPQLNEQISFQRAQNVKEELNLFGLQNVVIRLKAKGTQFLEKLEKKGGQKNFMTNRRISLHVLTQE